MRLRTAGILLLGSLALAATAAAQSTPAPSAITRKVIAAAKLPSVTDVPLHFRAMSVTLGPGETSVAAPVNGVLYQLSGSTEVLLGGEAKTLNVGEGLFIGIGNMATLKARSAAPSILPLHSCPGR